MHTAQGCILPISFQVDLLLWYVVINPPEKKLAKIILYALVPWVPYVDIIKELGLSTHVFYTTEVCTKKNKGRHGTFASISSNYFSYLQAVNAVWA